MGEENHIFPESLEEIVKGGVLLQFRAAHAGLLFLEQVIAAVDCKVKDFKRVEPS